MNTLISTLQQISLFYGMTYDEIEKILQCTNARQAEYDKGETVIWEGERVDDIGIVLSGHARSVKEDASGRTTIITLLETGSFIGLLLAASRASNSPVTVQASDKLRVLFIPFDKVVGRCANACARHDVLMRNCFDSIAQKSLLLHDRINCLIRPTLRDKIKAYLTRCADTEKSRAFMISLDRSAMAEYLNTDRSALSRELSRMKRDGLIDYYKNSFKLLCNEDKSI